MYLSNNTLLQGDKYRIVRHISSGGFGNTYEGVHVMMNTRVAVKEFFPKTFCNRDANTSQVTVPTQGNRELVDKLLKKFNEEARAVFQMKHDNIVRVLDIFEENGTAYYVMEYIDGRSLNDIVQKRGVLTEAEALGYIRQIAAALKYVHSLNRLHLDIKPGNIIVDYQGKAILIDFGASKHYDVKTGENTSTLMGVNTPGYAPIEQCTQGFTTFSPATDIYALGATLYKLLTGITPPDSNRLLAEEAILQPLPAYISAPTRKAVVAAMALKRKDRPQSIDEFLALLSGRVDNNERTLLKDEDTRNVYPDTGRRSSAKLHNSRNQQNGISTSKPAAPTSQNLRSNRKLLFGLIAVAFVVTFVGWFAFGHFIKGSVPEEGTAPDTIVTKPAVQETMPDSVPKTVTSKTDNAPAASPKTTTTVTVHHQDPAPARSNATNKPAAKPAPSKQISLEPAKLPPTGGLTNSSNKPSSKQGATPAPSKTVQNPAPKSTSNNTGTNRASDN